MHCIAWQCILCFVLLTCDSAVDTPVTDVTTLSLCCTPTSDFESLERSPNGRLLTSIKSRCQWCSREVIDPAEMPAEFIAYGIQMKSSTYERIAHVNKTLSKHNLLVGLENLGLSECNKYYLHFLYYEVGHCLAYLQESLAEAADNHVTNNSDDACAVDMMQPGDCDVTSSADRRRVLDGIDVITNGVMQAKTEELLLNHSGEYINLLVTKKLERPRKSRHVYDRPCLCQYIERTVFRRIV